MDIRDIIVGPVARNLARVVGGALMGVGLVTPEGAAAMNPDLVALIGAGLWAGAEALYAVAKRKGWLT